MKNILLVIEAGSVVLPERSWIGHKGALKELFRISYAVMKVLWELSVTGEAPELPIKGLTREDGQVLLAEYVAHFADPSDRLQEIVNHVKVNRSRYAMPEWQPAVGD